MKKVALYAAVAMTVATAFVPPSNAGPTDPPLGRKCGFNSGTDVTREAGWQTGDINAGPLFTGEAGTLVCTVHVNNNVHSGAALVTETAASTADAAAVMEPRALNYQATAADDVSLCTRWEGAGGTQYWTSPNPAVPTDTGSWSTNPNATCGVALSIEPNDPECSIWHFIDNRAGTNIAEIWQDCEPYAEFDPCAALGNPPGCPPLAGKPGRKPE